MSSLANTPLLDIRNLHAGFRTEEGHVSAVRGVNLTMAPGEAVALVGESGCGKSVTAHAILRLVPMPPGEITAGRILWQGQDLVRLPLGELNRLRAREIGIVFQEPMTALNPVYSIGAQIAETIRLHKPVSTRAALAEAAEMLDIVGIPDARRRLSAYPHHFSGGMRQRVMIAMALACRPKLLIADEPTTALDVTIQAQILDLLQDMRTRFGMAILLITHDMGVVAERAERAVVMYAGKIVEQAPVDRLFAAPAHPYTRGLIASIPRLGSASRHARLPVIPGSVPTGRNRLTGCRFAPRCPLAAEDCRVVEPILQRLDDAHFAACHRPGEEIRPS